MRRAPGLAALLVLLAIVAVAGVQAEGSGEIVGRLRPATPGAALQSGPGGPA